MRTFRDVVHKIVLKTGKHKRRPNPEGPETEYVPELAHMTPEEQESLWDVMDARGEGFGPAKGRDNPLYNRARSKSLFPAQLARCGICGGLMYRSLNDQLRCQHSTKRLGETVLESSARFILPQARSKSAWLLQQLKRYLTRVIAPANAFTQSFGRVLAAQLVVEGPVHQAAADPATGKLRRKSDFDRADCRADCRGLSLGQSPRHEHPSHPTVTLVLQASCGRVQERTRSPGLPDSDGAYACLS